MLFPATKRYRGNNPCAYFIASSPIRGYKEKGRWPDGSVLKAGPGSIFPAGLRCGWQKSFLRSTHPRKFTETALVLPGKAFSQLVKSVHREASDVWAQVWAVYAERLEHWGIPPLALVWVPARTDSANGRLHRLQPSPAVVADLQRHVRLNAVADQAAREAVFELLTVDNWDLDCMFYITRWRVFRTVSNVERRSKHRPYATRPLERSQSLPAKHAPQISSTAPAKPKLRQKGREPPVQGPPPSRVARRLVDQSAPRLLFSHYRNKYTPALGSTSASAADLLGWHRKVLYRLRQTWLLCLTTIRRPSAVGSLPQASLERGKVSC